MTGSAVGVTPRQQSSTPVRARLSGHRRQIVLKPTSDHSSRSRWSPRMLITQVGVVALAVGVWAYVARTTSDGSVPSPARTFTALAGLLTSHELWDAVRQTASTWLVGIVICTVVGIPIGLLIGSSRLATQSTRLTIDFVRNIPPVALVPLGLLLWGPTRSMVLLLVISGTIWPIVIQSIYASQQAEPQLRDVVRVFHLGKGWRLTHVFLPGVTPFVMTGLRVAATICLLLTITGELFGGAPGVGSQIQQALVGNDYPQMYAYVVVAAVLGLAVNSLIWIGQRRLLRWHPSFRQEA
jgi:ABC-type nitrate/sulfonate/bicarbonate transport system permease component